MGGGLGSSASYSTALVTGLLIHFGHIPRNFTEKDKNLINQWSFVSEQIIHGTPSGIDNTLTVFGGAKLYAKNGLLEDVKG